MCSDSWKERGERRGSGLEGWGGFKVGRGKTKGWGRLVTSEWSGARELQLLLRAGFLGAVHCVGAFLCLGVLAFVEEGMLRAMLVGGRRAWGRVKGQWAGEGKEGAVGPSGNKLACVGGAVGEGGRVWGIVLGMALEVDEGGLLGGKRMLFGVEVKAEDLGGVG